MKPSEDAKNFTTNVLRYRNAQGLTQRDLAGRSGIDHHAIGSIERGAGCTLATAASICRGLGKSLDEMVVIRND